MEKKNILFLIFVLIRNISSGSIIIDKKKSNNLKTIIGCNKTLINNFLKIKKDEKQKNSKTPLYNKICKNLDFTCCSKKNYKEILKNLKKGIKEILLFEIRIISIVNYFMKISRESFQKIKKFSENKIKKCGIKFNTLNLKSFYNLINYEDFIKKFNSLVNKIIDYYTGFGCQLCQVNIERFFLEKKKKNLVNNFLNQNFDKINKNYSYEKNNNFSNEKNNNFLNEKNNNFSNENFLNEKNKNFSNENFLNEKNNNFSNENFLNEKNNNFSNENFSNEKNVVILNQDNLDFFMNVYEDYIFVIEYFKNLAKLADFGFCLENEEKSKDFILLLNFDIEKKKSFFKYCKNFIYANFDKKCLELFKNFGFFDKFKAFENFEKGFYDTLKGLKFLSNEKENFFKKKNPIFFFGNFENKNFFDDFEILINRNYGWNQFDKIDKNILNEILSNLDLEENFKFFFSKFFFALIIFF